MCRPARHAEVSSTRGCSRGGLSARSAAGRGAVLLEVLLSLALLVAAGLTIIGLASQAAGSVERSRDRALALDLARSAMAEIEAGISRPETMGGPVESRVGVGEWGIEVETEPSQFTGLTLVKVRAIRYAAAGSEAEESSVTLQQLVRLGEETGAGSAEDPAGADLGASGGASRPSPDRPGQRPGPAGGGGARRRGGGT